MPQPIKGRRRFLAIGTSGLMALLGVLVAVPGIGYFFAPLRKRRNGETAGVGFQDVGAVDSFPTAKWQLAALEVVQQDGWEKLRTRHAVWVRRKGAGATEFDVLSPICPHLGCPLNWHPDDGQFVCPCHGGAFSSEGAWVSGPPPRSMDSLEFKVANGRLLVCWQDFKIGVSERVAVLA